MEAEVPERARGRARGRARARRARAAVEDEVAGALVLAEAELHLERRLPVAEMTVMAAMTKFATSWSLPTRAGKIPRTNCKYVICKLAGCKKNKLYLLRY